jgi:hypothetical protein
MSVSLQGFRALASLTPRIYLCESLAALCDAERTFNAAAICCRRLQTPATEGPCRRNRGNFEAVGAGKCMVGRHGTKRYMDPLLYITCILWILGMETLM